jgi:hypothetical protein
LYFHQLYEVFQDGSVTILFADPTRKRVLAWADLYIDPVAAAQSGRCLGVRINRVPTEYGCRVIHR